MTRYLTILALAAGMTPSLAGAQALAGAQDASGAAKPTVTLDFARLGFRATPLISNDRCDLAMTLDRKTFLAHVDELEKIGLINRDEAPTRIDKMPDTLALAFLLQMAPGQTEKLYRMEPKADLCHFTQYLTAEVDGIDSPLRVLTYDFSRQKFEQTDWASVSSERFIRSTTTLRFDRNFQKRLQIEGRSH